MAKGAYPTQSDVSAFLVEAGLTVTGLDLTTAAASGIAAFEAATGRKMLAGAAAARSFDPPLSPNSVLDLQADLATVTSVTVSGAAQSLNTDYRPLPLDAPSEGRPYNRLQLARKWYRPLLSGDWGTLVVTGQWGYGTTIPEDAWVAMITGAALERLPAIATALAGGLIAWKEADVEEQYGPQPLQALRDRWQATFDATVARYRRVCVGL